jgi:hypothetical protein
VDVHFLCHCHKENEPKEKASHSDASTRPAGSLRFFRAPHIAKAKPAFPPYTRPAAMTGQRFFYVLISIIRFFFLLLLLLPPSAE